METTSPNSLLLARLLKAQPTPQLRTLRREITRDLDAAQRSVVRLTQDLAEVDQELATRGDEVPERRPIPRPAVSLKDAVRLVFRERPGEWTADEIMAELERRQVAPGGRNPRNTLVTRLAEMIRAGEIARRGERYWALSGSEKPPPNNEGVSTM